MKNPALSILTVAKTHRSLLTGYLNHYGRKLGRQLYRQSRQSAASFLRSLTPEGRRTMYFRHDSIMLAAPNH